MDITEYNKIKSLTYQEYCDYLQDKYGIGLCDYMTKSFNKTGRAARTKEGLYIHHKMEDRVAMLGRPECAKEWPFEWQQKENLVYCDFLEHLWLHYLICRYPSPEKMTDEILGLGGIINFIVPELNDMYSGWEPKQMWQKNCHDRVREDKDVYLEMLKEIIAFMKKNPEYEPFIEYLFSSYGEQFGVWDRSRNKKIFTEILSLLK